MIIIFSIEGFDMSNQPYHNEGFGQVFLLIIFLTIALPILGIMTVDDTWDRFLAKYGAPLQVSVVKQ